MEASQHLLPVITRLTATTTMTEEEDKQNKQAIVMRIMEREFNNDSSSTKSRTVASHRQVSHGPFLSPPGTSTPRVLYQQ